MEPTHFVYLLTFTSGKVYVGMSRTDAKGLFSGRYRKHAGVARSGKNSPLYNAWRKHGAPEQTILSIHATREECALAEIDAIQVHSSMNPEFGYNLMAGGQGLNAPVGSAVYDLMRAKVWDNPERRRKSSEALKGKPLPGSALAAHKIWRESAEAKAMITSIAKRPEMRAKASTTMLRRLANGYREYLSEVQIGKPKNFTTEGRARIAAGRANWSSSEEGKARNRELMLRLRAQPANEDKRRAAHAAFLASDENKEHCRAMAAKVSKPVKDLATGEIFPSGSAAAVARGVTGPTIGYWIKKGKFTYL